MFFYLHSTFPAAEIEKEKGVIIEEINMYEDMPEYVADDRLMRLMYGDQPAGWNIAGDIPTVRSMTRRDFLAYHRDHYVAGKTVIVVSGGVDGSVLRDIERAFRPIADRPKKRKKKVVDRQKAPAHTFLKKDTQQTHVVVGFRGYDASDEREVAASLLAVVLGSGASSRLYHRMREELGICYYAYATHQPFTDHGIFKIAAGVTNSRLDEALSAIRNECLRLRDEPVPEAELRKAKDMVRGRMLLSLESSSSWAKYYGRLAVADRPLETVETFLRRLEKVTAGDLQAVARELFTDRRSNVSVVGPKFDKDIKCVI